MSIKSKIPKIIYTPPSPLIQIPKIEKLRSFFTYDNKQKKVVNTAVVKGSKSLAQEGHEEHIKSEMRKKEDANAVVDRLVKKSNRRIISIEAFSFIPFGLFTNTIEVEESRVIFIFKQPFTFQSHSLDIGDISNVFIESAFLFAKMQIVSRTFIQNDITVGYLDKQKADRVRIIIEGLRTFAQAKIDTSIYEIDELIEKLEELHRTR